MKLEDLLPGRLYNCTDISKTEYDLFKALLAPEIEGFNFFAFKTATDKYWVAPYQLLVPPETEGLYIN